MAAFPTTAYLDTFNRSDENPLGTSSAGYSWSTVGIFSSATERLRVSVNVVREAAAAICTQYITTPNFGPDVEVYATITNLGTSGEIFALYSRMTSAGTASPDGYKLQVDKTATNNVQIYRMTAGAVTSLVTFTQVAAVGDSFGFSTKDVGATVTLEAWYMAVGQSWVSLGTFGDSDAARKVVAGTVGLELNGPGAVTPKVDNFGGGTILPSETNKLGVFDTSLTPAGMF